jgi:hypothetical protein
MGDGLTYESYLDRFGRLTYRVVGTSMLPLLRQTRDLFIAEPKTEARCKVGDVALFRRPPDRYILHRVITVNERDYTTLGDHCVRPEYGVTDADILAVMTGFVRNGKEHSVTERGYRLYTAFWLHTRGVRVFLFRVRFAAARAFRTIFPKKHA